MKINHQLFENEKYIPDWNIKHLFLGTFNPAGGEYVRYYYGRRKNQTWPVLAKIFEDDRLMHKSEDSDFFNSLKENGIACMDLIKNIEFNETEKECILGRGYSDSKIINNEVKREYLIDEILRVIEANKECVVYSTWGNGSNLIDWVKHMQLISQKVDIVKLVSPSLVARVPKGEKKVEYIERSWEGVISRKSGN